MSQYQQELSVNNLLSRPPPPPPPSLASESDANFEPSFDYHRHGMHYEGETEEYYSEDQSFSNHEPQHFQLGPPRPFVAIPQNMYHSKNSNERLHRTQYQTSSTSAAKPAGLKDPWLANEPDKRESRKRQRSDSPCDDQDNSAPPPLTSVVTTFSPENDPKEVLEVPNASYSPFEESVEMFEIEGTDQLPLGLTVLFGPLKCDLCAVEVNSVVQAKMHYSGKIHEKKVGQFMQKWASENGEPLPKRYQVGAPKNTAGMTESDLYCEVCDLALTSTQHADQHYAGRNHKRALLGNAPLKARYFNKALGRWQRKPVVEPDPTGRFHIGKAFLATAASTDPLGLNHGIAAEVKTTPTVSPFSCQLCHINTTSYDQLDTHYKGAKHKKAMKNAGDSWSVERQKIPTPVAPLDSILASLVKKKEALSYVPKTPPISKNDMSIYRTPSGQYYCQPCNLTLNSEAQFSQHCDTKKHKMRMASIKKPMLTN